MTATPRPERVRLVNGLTAVLQPHDAAEVAAVQLWVRAGARDEGPDEAGLSHFIEHLLFKGTPSRGPGVIDQTISGLGGEMNAATSQDWTYFHVVLPAERLDTALDVLADAAQHAVLDPVEVERERHVVLEEIRRAEDTPSAALWRVLARRHYGEHAYGRPVLGSADSIAGVPREAIVDYYRRLYVPNNATVVVSGSVPVARCLDAVSAAFGGWAPHPVPARPRVAPEPLDAPRRVEEARALHQTYLGLAWAGAIPPAADVYALDLVTTVLGQGRASRLVQTVRERLGLVSGIGSSFYLQHDAAMIAVTARTSTARYAEIEAAVLAEVERLGEELVTEEEFARATTAVEAEHAFSRETAEGAAYALGTADAVWTLEFELGYVDAVRRVTREAMREAARRHLRPDRFTGAAIGGGDRGSRMSLTEDQPGAVPRDPGLLPGASRSAVAGLGPVTRLVLPNGLTVLVRENRGTPVVALTLLSRAGSADEAPELNGVTALLGRVLLKGTRARSAVEVARAAEEAGGGIETGADQEYGEVRAWGLARHWRRLLALLHEVATEPQVADEEVERERRVLLAQIRGLEDQPGQVANRVLARGLFGPRGYGLPPSGEEATVARIARADLLDRFRETYVADRLVLAVSGAVAADEVLTEVGRLFDRLPSGRPAPAAPPPPERPVRPRQRETSPTQQAHVLLGYLAPSVAAADHVALKVANGVLGGGMSSRLFRTLRDEEGLAYSVGSAYPTRRGAGRVVLHIGTAPDNVAAAEAGLRREVDRLAGEPVPEDELERTQAYLSGSFVLDRRTNGRQSFYLAFYELMGVGAEYVMRYPSLLEAVGATDVLRAARRHLVEPAVVVVGPA